MPGARKRGHPAGWQEDGLRNFPGAPPAPLETIPWRSLSHHDGGFGAGQPSSDLRISGLGETARSRAQ